MKYVIGGFCGAAMGLIVVYLGLAWYFRNLWR